MSFCVPSGQLGSAERLSPDTELALFISVEEQQALEQRQSVLSLSNSGTSPDEFSDETGDEQRDEGEEPVFHTANSYRYDGIVMKGNQVIGLWFGGSRVSDIEELTNTDLSVISSDGQIQLLKDEYSVILYPGDTYSPRAGSALNPAMALLESLTDSMAEVGGK